MYYNKLEFDFGKVKDKVKSKKGYEEASNAIQRVATSVESWPQEERAYALELARQEGFTAEIVKGYEFPAGNKIDGFIMYVPAGKSTEKFWQKLHEKYPK